MKNTFVVIFLLSVCCLSRTGGRPCHRYEDEEEATSEVDCSQLPCEAFTLREAIIRLWEIPQSLTELGEVLQSTILELVNSCDDSLLPLLLSASLWSVDLNSGLQSETAPSCVFSNLVETFVQYENDPSDSEPLREALLEYQNLAGQAIGYSIQIGLKGVGCPWQPMQERSNEECTIGEGFFNQLERSSLPESLKYVAIKLSESGDQADVNLALVVAATSTAPSLRFFSSVLDRSNSLLESVKLKSCNIKIEEECCSVREGQLVENVTQLGEDAGIVFGEVLDEL